MRKRAFTLIELLVVIAIITLLMGILLPALAKARATAKAVKDATQLKQVHTGFMTFSRQFDGTFPTPGLVNTEGVTPGVGEEDHTKNTTRHMYSVCIAQNFFTPQLLFCPTETNPNILAKNNYDHEAYAPIDDTYWDGDNSGTDDGWGPGEFNANLSELSHTSYAHSTLTGKRGRDHWNDSLDSEFGLVSNRGVIDGALNQDYEESNTLGFHGGREQWVGNVCYGDGHVILEDSFTKDGIVYEDGGVSEPDNYFAEETFFGGGNSAGSGWDIWLTFTPEVTGPNTIVVDPTAMWD